MRRCQKKSSILVLVDFENVMISARDIPPERFSIEAGFDRIIKSITEEIGEIAGIFAFLPGDRSIIWGEKLYSLGFNAINCPRIKGKDGEQDTTDERMMDLGEWLIDNIDHLTHVCICSGDKDFRPLLKKAALKGLKRIIVAANIRSLSTELIKLADKKPDGSRMIYLFSPTDEPASVK